MHDGENYFAVKTKRNLTSAARYCEDTNAVLATHSPGLFKDFLKFAKKNFPYRSIMVAGPDRKCSHHLAVFRQRETSSCGETKKDYFICKNVAPIVGKTNEKISKDQTKDISEQGEGVDYTSLICVVAIIFFVLFIVIFFCD